MRRLHQHLSTGLVAAIIALLVGGLSVVHSQEATRQPIATVGPVLPTSTTSTSAPTPTTTATLAPTTTTTTPPAAPAPTTTTQAPPAVTTPPTVAATPTTQPAAPAPVTDLVAYGNQLLRDVIPARWLAAVPARVEVIAGQTSWSNWSGLIEIGDWHLTRSVAKAKNVLAHEWGHQVAWHYGTDVYNGAPPAGFPYSGPNPAEQWADCVAEVLSGVQYPTSGLAPCSSTALTFTSTFLATGPGAPLR